MLVLTICLVGCRGAVGEHYCGWCDDDCCFATGPSETRGNLKFFIESSEMSPANPESLAEGVGLWKVVVLVASGAASGHGAICLAWHTFV